MLTSLTGALSARLVVDPAMFAQGAPASQ